MTIIIEDPELGNYYKGLIPYVDCMRVSLDTETNTYSLECDKTYDSKKYVGIFNGYPGAMDLNGKFIPGINWANGIIRIGKNDSIEVVNGIIKTDLIEESKIEEFANKKTSSNNLNLLYKHKIVPQCTNVVCCINADSKLSIHSVDGMSNSSNTNNIYGIFSGAPGDFYYNDKNKRYNRKYGNEHSSGIIILYGRFNFKYNYNKGKISPIIFRNSNTLKYVRLLVSN